MHENNCMVTLKIYHPQSFLWRNKETNILQAITNYCKRKEIYYKSMLLSHFI
jgi:hypothetical protein